MIKRIEVEGYRLLDQFAADMGQLTVVIGANAVGKSTLLDCLQCICQCLEYPFNNVLNLHGGVASLKNAAAITGRAFSWKITFHGREHWLWRSTDMEEEDMVYEVDLESDFLSQASVQHEVLRTAAPKRGYAEPLKFLEATARRKLIYNRRSHHLEPFDEATPTSSGVPQNPEGVSPKAQEPALMLSQIRFFNEFPTPSFSRLYLASAMFYTGFDVSRGSPLRTKAAEIRPETTLLANGENLGTVVHEILNRYEFRASANDLRTFLAAAYPTFEDIHCDTTYGTPPQVLVRVREKHMTRSMESWELSDGMLRFLCLATALLSPTSAAFIALDEPEVGLHPKLLPIVADMIKAASEKTQILVTTHSPDLLNRFDIGHIAVMKRDEDAIKAQWHRPSERKSLVQMLESIGGETLGDLHRSGELEAFN